MILLNCDMGESFGIWRLSIHIANVACSFHASDFNHMRTTVQLAKKHDVRVRATSIAAGPTGFRAAEDRKRRVGSGVRFQTLLYEGYVIPPFYDSRVLSELIVGGETRPAALALLRSALGALTIECVPSTSEAKPVLSDPLPTCSPGPRGRALEPRAGPLPPLF